MVSIEKNVPMPQRSHKGGAPSKYPWREMQVGDSFFVDDVKTDSMRNMAHVAGKLCGRKFTVSAIDGGVRVWRKD